MSGNGLDIGFRGATKEAIPVLKTAVGVDKDYPGYDGKTLPFDDASQNYVFASHCLEHIDNYTSIIKDWFRVLKKGGHLVITVPHKALYERKDNKPSKWNNDHRRFYTPGSLLSEIELALGNSVCTLLNYRIRECFDNDVDYDYNKPLDEHPSGAYEIVAVVEKLK